MGRRQRQFPFEGMVFRSKYEQNQAAILINEGINFEYETVSMFYTQVVNKGECKDCGGTRVVKVRSYTPDFWFPESKIFVETKGKFTPENRTKMKDITEQSEHDIRMVFMADNWLTRKHGMRYSRWCELNDIQFAVGNIPLSWLDKDRR